MVCCFCEQFSGKGVAVSELDKRNQHKIEVSDWVYDCCDCESWSAYWRDCVRPAMKFDDRFREILLAYDCAPLEDRVDSSFQCMDYCPFCGNALPHSLREEWFSELRAKFGDVWRPADGCPEEYEGAQWWIMLGH